jgi:hypothetical protein
MSSRLLTYRPSPHALVRLKRRQFRARPPARAEADAAGSGRLRDEAKAQESLVASLMKSVTPTGRPLANVASPPGRRGSRQTDGGRGRQFRRIRR